MEADKFEEIVCAYGAVLSAPDTFTGARDIKSLPYSKQDIKAALMSAFAKERGDGRNNRPLVGGIAAVAFLLFVVWPIRIWWIVRKDRENS